MSQEDEDYITPIFPLNAEKYQEGGATIRNVTQFLDAYSQKIMNNFKDGYTVGLTKSLVLPGVSKILLRDAAKAIVPFKTFADLKASTLVATSAKTSPYFFIYQFISKAEQMDELRIKGGAAYDEDKHLLLIEISIRLYVLTYLLFATSNTLCASGAKGSGDMYFKDYFQEKKEASLKDILVGMKTRWINADIQTCLFGLSKDDPGFTGFADFEILCTILYQYALIIFMEGENYPADLIKKFQESYYFTSMKDFIQEMEKKVDEMPAAAAAPVDDCVELKKLLDDTSKVADHKAITDAEVVALTALDAKYTKDFITTCIAKTTIFPAGEYAFAPVAAPPPDECIALKVLLDDTSKVVDHKAITDAEVAALTALDAKYTKDFITTCIAKAAIFPAGEYAFAPVAAPPPDECLALKVLLDDTSKVADHKAITDAEVAALTALDAKYTKDFITTCIAKAAIFPAGEYAFAVVTAGGRRKKQSRKMNKKTHKAGRSRNTRRKNKRV
jgi:hypothetical protein